MRQRSFLPAIFILACSSLLSELQAQTYHELFLPSSYDGVVTRSVVMEPASYQGQAVPLVITLHGMGGNAWDGLRGYDGPANARGWLVASPDTHGEMDPTGMNSLAARAAQRDVLDLLEYVQTHWMVDSDRVYLTGGSMGGMATTIIAAKFPDRFAAAAEWFGPSDLAAAYQELWFGNFRPNMEAEIGGGPAQFPWEYERRSSLFYARNLRSLPFVIGQGRFDFIVLPHHSSDLAAEIERFQPQHFAGIYWNNGAHFLFPGEHAMTLDWLGQFQRQPEPQVLAVQTDEDQAYYWLELEGAADPAWRIVNLAARSFENDLRMQLNNVRDLDLAMSRSGLDVQQDLELVVFLDADLNLELTELDPSRTYTVERNGLPWPDSQWDPISATLRIGIRHDQGGPEPFLIR